MKANVLLIGAAMAAMTAAAAVAAEGRHGAVAGDPHAKPVKVIFDTDMCSDFDDAGALGCLHALADRGLCEILATVSCTRGSHAVAMCEIINSYYGRPDIPVGSVKGMGVGSDNPPSEKDRIYGWEVAKYAKWIRHLDSNDAPDALDVYRKVLAAQPDKSVVICSVGFFTNLRKLVEADRDLVARKVRKWVAMGCFYPKGNECNSMSDAASTKIALENWPTPVVFSDFQYGVDCIAGKGARACSVEGSPVVDIFRRFGGRSAWDETAVLAAVYGPEKYFGTERGTFRMTGKGGENEWIPDAKNGPHLRIVEKVPRADVAKAIDELICRGRARED